MSSLKLPFCFTHSIRQSFRKTKNIIRTYMIIVAKRNQMSDRQLLLPTFILSDLIFGAAQNFRNLCL